MQRLALQGARAARVTRGLFAALCPVRSDFLIDFWSNRRYVSEDLDLISYLDSLRCHLRVRHQVDSRRLELRFVCAGAHRQRFPTCLGAGYFWIRLVAGS